MSGPPPRAGSGLGDRLQPLSGQRAGRARCARVPGARARSRGGRGGLVSRGLEVELLAAAAATAATGGAARRGGGGD